MNKSHEESVGPHLVLMSRVEKKITDVGFGNLQGQITYETTWEDTACKSLKNWGS